MGIMSRRNFLLIIRKGGNLGEVSRLCRALAEKTTFGVAPLRCPYPHLLLQRYCFFPRWSRGNPYLCVGKSLFVRREIPTARREIPILVAPATAAKDQRPTTKRGKRSGNVVKKYYEKHPPASGRQPEVAEGSDKPPNSAGIVQGRSRPRRPAARGALARPARPS
jgi:hypothetical protein